MLLRYHNSHVFIYLLFEAGAEARKLLFIVSSNSCAADRNGRDNDLTLGVNGFELLADGNACVVGLKD